METAIRFVAFVLFIVVSFCHGCALIRVGKLQQIPSENLETTCSLPKINTMIGFGPSSLSKSVDVPARRPSISIVVTAKNINVDRPLVNLGIQRKSTIKAYAESGAFSSVKPENADTDLRAEVHFLCEGPEETIVSYALAFVSGFTMTLIPIKVLNEYVVTTLLKDRHGNVLGSFKKSETISQWIQLFLIFMMPFNRPFSVPEETFYDLNRATIHEAHSKCLFST